VGKNVAVLIYIITDARLEIQTAALLAQLAATGTMFPSMHGGPYAHNQGGASGYNAGPSNTRSFVSPANLSSSYGSQPYPYFRGGQPPPPPLPQSQNHPSPTEPSRTRGRSHSQAGPSTSNATADADDDADDYEDKRTRNTAASGAISVLEPKGIELKIPSPSARFRIKKKQKTLALERTVSDLTGRAEDLEREAADLRRENGWLKVGLPRHLIQHFVSTSPRKLSCSRAVD
jgi:hypothetical protein